MTDRDRLVKLMKEVRYPVFPNSDNMADFGIQHSDHVFETVANHLIASGVTVLPCKPGDTVYATHWPQGFGVSYRLEEQKHPLSKGVQYISFMTNGEILLHFKGAAIPARYFGEYIFATREEALAALEGLRASREGAAQDIEDLALDLCCMSCVHDEECAEIGGRQEGRGYGSACVPGLTEPPYYERKEE